MKVTLEFQTEVEASLEELCRYHSHPLVFYRLVPPWGYLKVIHRDPEIKVGAKTHIQLKIFGRKRDLIVKHTETELPHGFKDEQEIGPFKSYVHDHIFTTKDNKTYLIDHLDYELPFGFFGYILGGWLVKRSFKKLFRYRHKLVSEDLKHLALAKGKKRTKVLVSGSHGFVGSQLELALDVFGMDVYTLVREKSTHPKEVYFDTRSSHIDKSSLEGFDAVIHLGGANVANKRWTKKERKNIYESRVKSTTSLANTLNTLNNPPKTFLVASGVHFYGSSPGEVLDETAPKGTGFLSDVVNDWEKAAEIYQKGNVLHTRFGAVLGLRGGMLKKTVILCKSYLGAIPGSGDQKLSWIVIDDLIYQIFHLITAEKSNGVYNLVSPNSVSQKEFIEELSKQLFRKVYFKIPKWVIVLVYGRRGKELLLSDINAVPKRLLDEKAYFSYPKLFDALKHLLGS